ncbi:hypothetical protein [Marivirga lumbricoides]
MAKTYSDKELENILKERYNDKFNVLSNDFVLNLGYHQFTAELANNKAIVIHGTYKQKGEEISDNFPQMLHTYQCSNLIKAKLNNYYPTFKFKNSTSFNYKEINHNPIPPLEEIVMNESVSGSVDLILYLFETAKEENKKEVLEGVSAIVKEFTRWKNKSFHISVKFWEDGHFKGKDLDNINFGFNVYKEEYYDSIPVENEYIQQVLYFEFDTKDSIPNISTDDLYESIYPFENGKGFKQKLVKF